MNNRKRLDELDFLKAVFILLMISFHLVYFESLYPVAKQVVYTFHMPGFLIISGYLMRVEKPMKGFLRSMWRLALPYLFMESAYIVMASILPINEHIEQLETTLFIDKLFMHPLGPYWYLRSLLICGFVYYAVLRIPRLQTASRLTLLALIYGLMAWGNIVPLWHPMYFLIGTVIQQCGAFILNCFPVTWLSTIGLIWLVQYPQYLHPVTLGGLLIVVLAMGLGIWLYSYIPAYLRTGMLLIGRNTLPIYIYSPIFTLLCKKLVPYLQFDPSGMLFLVLSLTICVTGGMAIDKTLQAAIHLTSRSK